MPKSQKTTKRLTSGARTKSAKVVTAQISQIEVEDRTADLLEDTTGFEIRDNEDLRARQPSGLEMNDNVIRGLKDPIEKKYFADYCAVVDENDLARSSNVKCLSDVIWAGIPAENKKK